MLFRYGNFAKKIIAFIALFAVLTPSWAPVADAFLGFGESELTVPEVKRVKVVSMLVDEKLLENKTLKEKIENYASDVQTKVNGRVVFIPVPRDASPWEIYEGNAHLYFSGIDNDNRSQLVGTVLVGDVPIPIIEKNGALHATVFPYLDFEDVVYKWDRGAGRFVFSGGDFEPEIWHGVIKSDWNESDDPVKVQEAKEKELEDYFDRNHKVHTGETTFAKKIFFADLPRQKKGLTEVLRQRYQNWIDYVEDYLYLRFNKHWADILIGSAKDVVPWNLMPPESKSSSSSSPNTNPIPDVFTKSIIETFLKRYHEAYNSVLSLLATRIGVAGRWTPEQIDTTMTLVSQKDEVAARLLKRVNDQIESTLGTALESENVAAKISVPTESYFLNDPLLDIFPPTKDSSPTEYTKPQANTTVEYSNISCKEVFGFPVTLYSSPISLTFPDLLWGSTRNIPRAYPPVANPFATDPSYPDGISYWYGLRADQLTAEKCSMFRGSSRSSSYPISQKIEGNRSYDFATKDDSCYNDLSDGIFFSRFPTQPFQIYSQCCANAKVSGDSDAKYLDIGESNFAMNALQCIPTRAAGEIFDLAGTRENSAGSVGAQGCDSIIVEKKTLPLHSTFGNSARLHTFSSLMIHDEPKESTIKAQLSASTTPIAIPVDDPRGFSFYNHGYVFNRLSFLNLFDYRKHSTDVNALEADILAGAQQKIEELNRVTVSGNYLGDQTLFGDLNYLGFHSFQNEYDSQITETTPSDTNLLSIIDETRDVIAKRYLIYLDLGALKSQFEAERDAFTPTSSPEWIAADNEVLKIDSWIAQKQELVLDLHSDSAYGILRAQLDDLVNHLHDLKLHLDIGGLTLANQPTISGFISAWESDVQPQSLMSCDNTHCSVLGLTSDIGPNVGLGLTSFQIKLSWTEDCEDGNCGKSKVKVSDTSGGTYDGVYLENGTKNGKPVYKNETNYIWWDNTAGNEKWGIGTLTTHAITADVGSEDNPELANNWSEGIVWRDQIEVGNSAGGTYDGTYKGSGSKNGKPVYNLDNTYYIWWDNTLGSERWGIGDLTSHVVVADLGSELTPDLAKWDPEVLLLTTGVCSTSSKIYEAGGLLKTDLFQSVFDSFGFENIARALIWLDTDIRQKNTQVFTSVLSDPADAQKNLFENFPNFADDKLPGYVNSDGYELAEIIADPSDTDPGGSVKVDFERGEEKASDLFSAKQLESEEFSFGQQNPQKFMGMDFQKNILGNSNQKPTDKSSPDEIENCADKTIFEWPSCAAKWVKNLPSSLKKTTNITLPSLDQQASAQKNNSVLETKQSSGKPFVNEQLLEKDSVKLFPAFQEGGAPTKVSNLSVDPGQIIFSGENKNPQKVVVSLLSSTGQIVKSDFSTPVSIDAVSGDLDQFFDILPAKTVEAREGKVEFYLVPKDSAKGEISLQVSVPDMPIQKFSAQVSSLTLDVFLQKDSVFVDDPSGILVEVKVRDNEGNISHEKDGRPLIFSSEWGIFPGGSEVIIEDGLAKTLFVPLRKSGKARLTVTDPETKLAPESVSFTVYPGSLAQILLESDSSILVDGGDSVFIKGNAADQFGNFLPEETTKIKWEADNLEILPGEDGLIFIKVKPEIERTEKNVKTIHLVGKTPSLPDKEASLDFTVVKTPKIVFDSPVETVTAGDETLQKISVRMETQDEQLITSRFEASILSDPADIGIFPKNFLIKDGLGIFEFSAGTRAGKTAVTVSCPGFQSTTFSFEVAPDVAQKIKLRSEKQTINANDTLDTIIKVQLFDQFGNLATGFGGNITLEQNPPIRYSEQEREEKINYLHDEVGMAKGQAEAFVDNEVAESAAEQNQNLVDIEYPVISVVDGIGETKINPKGIGGKLYFLAQGEAGQNLIPDILEMEVTGTLARSDFSQLSPKSLFTLLLGFAGGNLGAPNLGNRFLFSGQTQGVATVLENPESSKQVATIDAYGKITGEVIPQIRPETYFELEFLQENQKISDARIYFETAPQVFVGENPDGDDPKFVFIPTDLTQIRQDASTISFQGDPIFSVGTLGGVRIQKTGITFELGDTKNIFEWDVKNGEDVIGKLKIFPGKLKFLSVADFEGREDTGVFVRSLAPEINVQSAFTGKSTNDLFGIGIFDTRKKEDSSRALGFPDMSAEDIKNNSDVGWSAAWKPGTLFAAGASIGESTKWSGSDAFILLGDPTLTVQTKTPARADSQLGISADIGKPLWKSPVGSIDQIIATDINGDRRPGTDPDKRSDILLRIKNQLFALYQDYHQRDNFKDIGPILRFADGAKKVRAYEDSEGKLKWLIQLNDKGNLIFHEDNNGTFERKTIDLGIKNPIVDFEVARLNDDNLIDAGASHPGKSRNYNDLVLLDDNNTFYFVYGRDGGFYAAQKLDDSFTPTFAPIEEDYEVAVEKDLNFDENPHKFEQLDTFFVNFDGIEEGGARTDYFQTVSGTQFISIAQNRRLNAKLTIKGPEETTKLKKGDLVKAELRLSSDLDLPHFKLLVPNYVQFELNKNSIRCQGPDDLSDFKTNIGPSSFFISGFSIPAQTPITCYWNFKVKSIDPVKFDVSDFAGKDGIDDILIAWDDGETKQFVKYLSTDSPAFPEEGKPTDATPDSPESIIPQTHSLKRIAAFPPVVDNTDYEKTAQSTFSNIKNQPYDISPKSVKSCADGCSYIPSYTLLGPGNQTVYVPPIGVAVPSMPQDGVPVFYLMASPPFVGAGSNPSSIFRMYIMPTTNGASAMGICSGTQSTFMTAPTWTPNCFVTILTKPGLGACSGATSSFTDTKGRLMFLGNDGSGKFKPKNMAKPSNIIIDGVDIISAWVQRQFRELSNYKFPSINLLLPKFPKSNAKNDKNKSVLEKLEQSPFIKISRRPISIPYPEFSSVQLDQFETDFKIWKEGVRLWKEDLLQQIRSLKDQIKNLSAQVDADLKTLQSYADFFKGKSVAVCGKKVELEELKQKRIAAGEANDQELDSQIQHTSDLCLSLSKSETEFSGLLSRLNSIKSGLDGILKKIIDLEKVADNLERMVSVMETNLKSLKSYPEGIAKLKNLPQEFQKLFESLQDAVAVFSDFWVNWIEANKVAVEKWKKFTNTFVSLLNSWSKIPEIFSGFTEDCAGCPITRGSYVAVLIKLLLGWIKLPIVKIPHLPDITFDLSRLGLGIRLWVPEINLQPVPLRLPDLPSIPKLNEIDSLSAALSGIKIPQLPPQDELMRNLEDLLGILLAKDLGLLDKDADLRLLSINGNIEKLLLDIIALDTILRQLPADFSLINFDFLKGAFSATIPVFPAFPNIPIDLKVPTIKLPALPTILEPPSIPDILKPINAVISSVKSFLSLFCTILGGIAAVPEYKVASQVAEQTNRVSIIPVDLVVPAQVPSIPKAVVPEVEIKLTAEPISVLEDLNKQLDKAKVSMDEVVQKMSLSGRGVLESDQGANSKSTVSQSDSQEFIPFEQLEKNISYEEGQTVVSIDLLKEAEKSDWVGNFEKSYAQKTESPIEKQGILAQTSSLINQKITGVFHTLLGSVGKTVASVASSQGWLASTNDVSPEKAKEDAQAPAIAEKIYYYDSQKDVSESVSDFPVDNKTYTSEIKDLDLDGEKEILYSIGSELYLKRIKTPIESDQDWEYKSPDNITIWSFETFAKKFVPVVDIDSKTEADGSQISFVRLDPEIPYYEWIISDRPDREFELGNQFIGERISKEWRRIGFLIRKGLRPYQVRPMSARLLKIKGNPLLYGSPLKNIPVTGSQEVCDDKTVPKPFFPDKSVLVGVAPESRMRIRVLPREGHPEEFQDLVLRKGEETLVDYAEVCLTRGGIQQATLENMQKLEPEEGGYFSPNMRLELGPTDEVTLRLYDGKDITVYGNEHYELHYFEKEQDAVEQFKLLQLGNHYGEFFALNDTSRSFSISKFIHDPQVGDDKKSPTIQFLKGTHLTALLNEKIEVDASKSFDNQQIGHVWWDFDPTSDTNGDGDPTNDVDFPADQSFGGHIPKDFLKVLLPAHKRPESFSVVLNVTDQAGNASQKTVDIDVEAPKFQLYDASLQDREITGKVIQAKSGIDVSFSRDRSGVTSILKRNTVSQGGGEFKLSDLVSSGGAEIYEKITGQKDFEILPTGRPIIFAEKDGEKLFIPRIESATQTTPMRIEIQDRNGEIVSLVSLVSSSSDDVVMTDSFDQVNDLSSVAVHDTDPEDSFIWEPFASDQEKFSGSMALLDTNPNKTIGVLDPHGNFYLLEKDAAYLRIKKGGVTDSLIFEVVDSDNKVLAEFFVPVSPKVWVQQDQ